MKKKIQVYINGNYEFTSEGFTTCKALKDHIRAVKHIAIAIPSGYRHLTVYDYDNIQCKIAH